MVLPVLPAAAFVSPCGATSKARPTTSAVFFMGGWQGVAKDCLKFYLGLPCLTLLRPLGGPPLKRPYGCYRGGPLTGWATYGRILPFWTCHAVRLYLLDAEFVCSNTTGGIL
jgi:hypothetical protein